MINRMIYTINTIGICQTYYRSPGPKNIAKISKIIAKIAITKPSAITTPPKHIILNKNANGRLAINGKFHLRILI